MIEGKTKTELYLGKGWDDVGYIFRGSLYSKSQSFLAHETANGETMVEVICGGRDIENTGISYLERAEVQEIAVALSKITEKAIRRRFKQGQNTQPKLYRYNWSEGIYKRFLEICLEVKDFYIDAANQGKGILIHLE